MKKKIIAALLAGMMVFSLVACGGNGNSDSSASGSGKRSSAGSSGGKETINLWAYTDEVPNMVEEYIKLNPEFAKKYDVNVTLIATTEGAYQPALDQALVAGGKDAPDIYCAEQAFVLKYTQGDMAEFALPYSELGIEVDSMVREADIAQYTIEIGSRDGEIVGLGFQATGGAVIYRRSIAQAVWGTDDPEVIKTKIGPGWDKFMAAAGELNDKGYSILSGGGDLWQAIRNTAKTPWVVNGELQIDSAREEFLDFHKELHDKGYTNDTTAWQDAWIADMSGTGAREVFAFMGPAWLINYVMVGNSGGEATGEGTYGDWAVSEPPVGFFWGGTWLLANAQGNEAVKDGVAELIEWITLDSTDDGLQYKWANGTIFGEGGAKDSVGSAAVMEKSNGELEFLGGQNMFDVFVPAGAFATGVGLSQYDETINQWFIDQTTEYANGNKSREQAIEDFKQQVADNLDVIVK